MSKKVKKKKEEKSMLGKIIDLPLEDFKKEVCEQKIPIGVVHNTKLNLIGAFNELKVRKDGILDSIAKKTLNKDDPKVRKTLDGLYAEMVKIEQKTLYLTEREKELADLESGVVDSVKH